MVTYPKDWAVTELGEKCEVTSSKRVFESEWKNAGIPFLRTRDIASLQAGTEQKDKLYISESTYKEKISVSGEPAVGDLLVTGVGTIGLPYLISNVPMYFKDGNILWIKSSDAFVPKFLYLMFLSKEVKQQIEDGSGFTTVGTLTIKNAKKLNLPCPDTDEQEAIAETLSCIDGHIANLTELIEKKKAIRDGALEDLVSCRTRLEGFDGEWKEMSLSRFTDINPRTDIPDSFMYVDLESVKGISLIRQRRENKYSAPSRARRFAQKGDVFYQTVRPYQKNNYLFNLEGDYVFSTGYAQLRTKNDPDYLFLLIRQDSFVNDVLDNCTGTSYPAINPKKLSEINIYVPTDIDEQRAISKIITVMDDEIGSLEEETNKMLQIKTGAMDDLLTGRVRLTRQGG